MQCHTQERRIISQESAVADINLSCPGYSFGPVDKMLSWLGALLLNALEHLVLLYVLCFVCRPLYTK